MSNKIFKQIIKIDELILALSLGYLGLLFAGRADLDLWIFVTIALISAKIAHVSFQIVQYDKHRRSTASGRLIYEGNKKNIAIWAYGFISSAVFIFSSFMINELCYYLSVLSVIFLIGFPLLRKYSSLPDYNIGIFETCCSIGGFIAADNRFELIALILGASIFLWTAGLGISRLIFETRNGKNNVLVTAYRAKKRQIISVLLFLSSLSMLILSGINTGRGLTYWISLFCFAIILTRQEILLKSKDIETAKKEFLQINDFIAPVLLIGTIIDIFYK